MTRVKLSVYVDLDPIPGVFHTARSARDAISEILNNMLLHYNPVVYVAGDPNTISHTDSAILIMEDMLLPGGLFFQHDEAYIGWYCVRSTNPEKRDLFLPPHIFRKCFKYESAFADGADYRAFHRVIELS